MLQNMQEAMFKNYEEMKREISVVRTTQVKSRRMQIMDRKCEAFQQQITKNEQKLLEVEQSMEKEERRVEEINEKLTLSNKELEMIFLKAGRAAQYFTFPEHYEKIQ
uniref:Uncharacterized protein n=1 Tax=Micrurus spixii TaxID=129469 RepID=A0A2D4MXY0_9SAUR